MVDIARYFYAVLQDGDWLNDWLTHIPFIIREVVEAAGSFTAHLLGR